jgi:mRNA interferase RelE/StbE
MLELVSILKNEPIPYKAYDISKLRGRVDIYRIRLGDLRIVYHIDWISNFVDIEFIGPRGQAYKDN